MTNSKHVIELLPDFLLGSFNEHERAEIQSHLQSCPECKREYEDLTLLWNSLGELPAQKSSQAMRDRFLAMITAYEHGIRHAESKSSFLGTLNGWIEAVWPSRPAIQIALSLALFLVGGVAGTQINRSIEKGVQTESNNEIAELRGEVQTMTRMLAVSLLQQQSASERLRGVSMSYRLEEQDNQFTGVLMNTLKYDPSPNVRLAALDALTRSVDRDRVRRELIKSLPEQTSPMVQIAMLDLIVQNQEVESKPVLEQMLRNPKIDKTVKKRVEDSIKQIL